MNRTIQEPNIRDRQCFAENGTGTSTLEARGPETRTNRDGATEKEPMLVKENTVPRNHVAARPPAGKTNRADKPTNGPRRRILVIGAVIGALGLFFGIRYFLYASSHEDTDDAYVTGYTHQISSRITGTVEEVLVDDNWHVTAGQPLLKLDPRDYQVALEKDRASYVQARAQLVQASAQIPLAEAQLAQAQAQADSSKANSDYLQRTFERNRQLFYQGRGVISKQDLDTAQSQAETSVATYKANLAAVNVARENVKVAHAQEEAARAQANAAMAQVKNSELIDKPYPEAPENEKPSHQLASEPITQIRDVPATGVMQ